MICPVHKKTMVATKTKYGLRESCPITPCDFVSWNGSLPANSETREARTRAHLFFDRIWQSGKMTRNQAYAELASYMRLSVKKTHIGSFSGIQCQIVLDFIEKRG